MHTTDIEIGPPWPTYNTFEEAIAASDDQPGQAKAKRDSLEIAGAILESGLFGLSSCVLHFSNGKNLLAEARDFHVEWVVSEGDAPTIVPVPCKHLRHTKSDQRWNFDPGEMLSEIIGSELVMIRVAVDRDLLVYTRGNEIFWLSAYRECASRSDLLHAVFETYYPEHEIVNWLGIMRHRKRPFV